MIDRLKELFGSRSDASDGIMEALNRLFDGVKTK